MGAENLGVVPGWGMVLGGPASDVVWFVILGFGFTGLRGSNTGFWEGSESLFAQGVRFRVTPHV